MPSLKKGSGAARPQKDGGGGGGGGGGGSENSSHHNEELEDLVPGWPTLMLSLWVIILPHFFFTLN